MFLHGWGAQPREPARHRHALPAHASRAPDRPAGLRRGAAAAGRLGHDSLHRSGSAVPPRSDLPAPVVLVGHSFGGRVSVRLAARHLRAGAGAGADGRARSAAAAVSRERAAAHGGFGTLRRLLIALQPIDRRAPARVAHATVRIEGLPGGRRAAVGPRPDRERGSDRERAARSRVRRCCSGAPTTPRRRRGWPALPGDSSAAGRRSTVLPHKDHHPLHRHRRAPVRRIKIRDVAGGARRCLASGPGCRCSPRRRRYLAWRRLLGVPALLSAGRLRASALPALGQRPVADRSGVLAVDRRCAFLFAGIAGAGRSVLFMVGRRCCSALVQPDPAALGQDSAEADLARDARARWSRSCSHSRAWIAAAPAFIRDGDLQAPLVASAIAVCVAAAGADRWPTLSSSPYERHVAARLRSRSRRARRRGRARSSSASPAATARAARSRCSRTSCSSMRRRSRRPAASTR